jgi:hypothetical protein
VKKIHSFFQIICKNKKKMASKKQHLKSKSLLSVQPISQLLAPSADTEFGEQQVEGATTPTMHLPKKSLLKKPKSNPEKQHEGVTGEGTSASEGTVGTESQITCSQRISQHTRLSLKEDATTKALAKNMARVVPSSVHGSVSMNMSISRPKNSNAATATSSGPKTPSLFTIKPLKIHSEPPVMMNVPMQEDNNEGITKDNNDDHPS